MRSELWFMRFTSLISVKALLLATFAATIGNAEASTIQVPPGTQIVVTTVADLKPDNLNVGDMVALTVVSDVVVNGKVIIKAGAAAQGEVVSSKKNNFIGIPGAIGVALRTVTTVDGKNIPISASKHVKGDDKMVVSIGLSLVCCILFALIKGGEATIPAGTQMNGTTTMAVDVTA
jgi:hypothetical protein